MLEVALRFPIRVAKLVFGIANAEIFSVMRLDEAVVLPLFDWLSTDV